MFEEILFRFPLSFSLVTTKPQARKLKESKQFQPVRGRRALGCLKLLINKRYKLPGTGADLLCHIIIF